MQLVLSALHLGMLYFRLPQHLVPVSPALRPQQHSA
jgi:hypothetical protein